MTETERNRTFLSLEICKRIYNEDERYQNTPGGVPNRQAKIASDPLFAYHVHSGPRYPQRAPGLPTDRQYNALLPRDDGSLENLVIIPKRGQQFANAATPWEFINSTLCSGGGLFNPVVDASMAVTGHYADVSQNLLIHPEKINFKDISDYIKNDVELFYWNYTAQVFNPSSSEFSSTSVNPPPAGWAVFKGTSYNRVSVLVQPNGRVKAAQGHLFSRNNGQAIATWSPLDFWTPGSRLAAGAIRAFTNRAGAAAKAGFQFLKGPTKELAEAAVVRLGAGETLTGIAVTARGAVRMETVGARRAVMAVDDMQELKYWLAQSKSADGLFDLVIHGDTTSFYILERGAWKRVSVKDVADTIRPHLAPGDQIRLLACETGTHGGPAQQLANELKRTIWAPTTSVYPKQGIPIMKDGKVERFIDIESFVPVDKGKFFPIEPQ